MKQTSCVYELEDNIVKLSILPKTIYSKFSRSEMPVDVCFLAQPLPYLAPWNQLVDLLQSGMRDLSGRQYIITNPQSPLQQPNQIPLIANGASSRAVRVKKGNSTACSKQSKDIGLQGMSVGLQDQESSCVQSQFLKLSKGRDDCQHGSQS